MTQNRGYCQKSQHTPKIMVFTVMWVPAAIVIDSVDCPLVFLCHPGVLWGVVSYWRGLADSASEWWHVTGVGRLVNSNGNAASFVLLFGQFSTTSFKICIHWNTIFAVNYYFKGMAWHICIDSSIIFQSANLWDFESGSGKEVYLIAKPDVFLTFWF